MRPKGRMMRTSAAVAPTRVLVSLTAAAALRISDSATRPQGQMTRIGSREAQIRALVMQRQGLVSQVPARRRDTSSGPTHVPAGKVYPAGQAGGDPKKKSALLSYAGSQSESKT